MTQVTAALFPRRGMLNSGVNAMNQHIMKFRTIAVTDLSDPASAALRYAPGNGPYVSVDTRGRSCD